MRTTRTDAFLVIGVVIAFVGGVLALSGTGPLTMSRDADGYYMTDTITLDRASRAIVAGDIDMVQGCFPQVVEDSLIPGWAMAEPTYVRMEGFSMGAEVFLGIAATADVEAYLNGTAHDEIAELYCDVGEVQNIEYTRHEGTVVPARPDEQTFWVAQGVGPERHTLEWTVEEGDWTAVIMNSDGSLGITAEVELGAKVTNLQTIGWTMMAIGLVLLAGGLVMAVRAFRTARRHRMAPPDTDQELPERAPTPS